ncbi:hypothetical protein P3T76_008071 [Phytophthora citrophthora]|uniref:Uncharacterized protein n=1 Tax=Phytophthora citrophthora TaxID=4793 RepID=A0AAD9GLH0_9STRA|nr:hypothetical protein P3T76_008071 [Phytophthora citrophthora]
MGNTRSSSSSSSPSQFEIKDALALCEDGDLLLAREKLTDCALHVAVEFVVARDIQRMHHGQFPTQRVTSLPRTCELLLRYEGVLRVVSVGAAGLQFVPFEERVASKMPNIRDRFVIRRLRHDIRSESLSSVLRELAIQIASVAPISWHALLFSSCGMKMSPRSPRERLVDREGVVAAFKELPLLVQRLMKRMLELFCVGLKLDEFKTASSPNDELQRPTDSPDTSQSLPLNVKSDDNPVAVVRIALETLGFPEVTARLSAAFVAAVYEYSKLMDPIPVDRSEPVLPEAFWSSSSDNNRLVLNPPTALGPEVFLNRSK